MFTFVIVFFMPSEYNHQLVRAFGDELSKMTGRRIRVVNVMWSAGIGSGIAGFLSLSTVLIYRNYRKVTGKLRGEI